MATFYVDRDGRGGVNGNDSTWTVAARAGDATKPFATIQAAMTQVYAANNSGGDTIMVRQEKTSTPYAQPTVANAAPTTKNTVKGYINGSTIEKPTVAGYKFDTCTRWRWEGFQMVGTMWIVTGNYIETVNNIGKNRGGGSTAMGNILVDGANNCTWDGNDIRYSGPLDGLKAAVVALNMRDPGSGVYQANNVITNNYFDRFPGDIINMPTQQPNQDPFTGWKINNNEFGRNYNVVLTSGSTPHADILQMEGNTLNFEFMNNIMYGDGWGRLMIMPRQNGTGQSAGWGKHDGIKIINNVWYGNSGECMVMYNAPNAQIISNIFWPGVDNPNRIKLQFSQGMASGQIMPSSYGMTNVRFKNNICRGLTVVDYGGTVTFASDSGFNMFPDASKHVNYTKKSTDFYATATWVDVSSDNDLRIPPNLRYVAGSRGINEGPLTSDSTQMLGMPATDADGKGAAGTRRDVGAYEFGGTDSTGGGTGGGGGGTGGGSTGTAGPVLGGSVYSEGTGTGPWGTITNVLGDEASPAVATRGLNSGSDSGISADLRVSGFSLPLPSGATINSLTVTVNRRQNNAQSLRDYVIQLYANGALVGTNQADTATDWPASYTTKAYTGMFGLSAAALTAAVAAADFSVVLKARNTSSVSSTAAVNYIKVQADWSTTVVVPSSPPVGSLTISPNPVAAGADVTFDSTGSTGEITGRELSTDGGVTYTYDMTSTPTLTTTLPAGTYSVILRTTGPGGTHLTTAQTLTVSSVATPPPAANFSVSPNPVTEGNPVTFDLSATTGSYTQLEVSTDGGATWATLPTGTTSYTTLLPNGTYSTVARATGAGGSSLSAPVSLVVNPSSTTPPPALYVPYSPQIGCKYVLTAPDGTRAVFNDKTDVDYVGDLFDISGLDSAEIRESAADLVAADGGIHGDFYFGRRPITLSARVYNATGPLDRDYRIDKARHVVKQCLRANGVLSWTNNPVVSNLAMRAEVRMQQPLRVTGNWVKDIQLSLVSQFTPLFSDQLQTASATNLGTAKTGVVNRGDYPAYPILTITGASNLVAGATGIAFFNTTTGRVLRLDPSFVLMKSEVVEFDLLNHTGVVRTASTASGARAVGTDLSQYIDFDTTTWPTVAPGSNNFQVLASKASGETQTVLGTYSFTYRHAWA